MLGNGYRFVYGLPSISAGCAAVGVVTARLCTITHEKNNDKSRIMGATTDNILNAIPIDKHATSDMLGSNTSD